MILLVVIGILGLVYAEQAKEKIIIDATPEYLID